jgi:hypothetical protein
MPGEHVLRILDSAASHRAAGHRGPARLMTGLAVGRVVPRHGPEGALLALVGLRADAHLYRSNTAPMRIE